MPKLDPFNNPCPSCGAQPGAPCTRVGYNKRVTVSFHIDRKATTSAAYVQLPLNPPHALLTFLAGDPLILTPADEHRARGLYTQIIERAKR
jgi:hypothetical protein